MTREERILGELNKAEQRVKRFVLEDKHDKVAEEESEILGMLNMLGWLGYRAIEDTDKCESVKGIWINTYKAIEDIR